MHCKYLLLPCLAFNLSYAMEQDSEQTPAADTVIETQKNKPSNPDSKNIADVSIWFSPNYNFPEKFSRKKANKVPGILASLATKEGAPIKEKAPIQKLRKAITKYALYERTKKIGQECWVYLTATKDNAAKLREKLETEDIRDIVGQYHVFDRSEKNYKQQGSELLEYKFGDYSIWFQFRQPEIFEDTKWARKQYNEAIEKYALYTDVQSLDYPDFSTVMWHYVTVSEKNLPFLEKALAENQLIEKGDHAMFTFSLSKDDYSEQLTQVAQRSWIPHKQRYLLNVIGGLTGLAAAIIGYATFSS